jgi:sulfur carrier protein ThiS
MRITLKLFATFRRYMPPNSQGTSLDLEVPTGTPVADVLNGLDVPTAGGAVILVNGRTVEPGHVLQEGDTVAVFPAMAGG